MDAYTYTFKDFELRPNNFVQLKGSKSIIDDTVFRLKTFGQIIQSDRNFGTSINKSDLAPVEITQEWFERIDKTYWVNFHHGNRKIIQHVTFRTIKLELIDGDTRIAFHFNNELINLKDYVHQVQNLFADLTDTELTFKEKKCCNAINRDIGKHDKNCWNYE